MLIQTPEAFEFLYDPPLGAVRYRIAYGGRGSAKSWQFGRALLALGATRPLRVLCVREVQGSIKESVHTLLRQQIKALELDYQVLTAEIRHPIGTQFIFKGLRDPDALKSAEGVDICWPEEAHSISRESWRRLIPTIRKEGSEIWITFNPDLDTDPTWVDFVLNPRPGSIIAEVGWQDNPWFPEVLRREKDYDYSVDPDAAEHVWGGKTRGATPAQILRGKWIVDAFEPGADWDGPYQGLDFGFSVDPTALVRFWLHGRRLYVEHEAYQVGLELDETTAFLCKEIEGAARYVTRADSSEAQAISYLRRHGLPRIAPVDKWPGSIEDGIRWLRQLEAIVVHPRCTHVAQECRLYSYKVDRRTGDVLPEVVDKHNHTIDGIRYGAAPLIKPFAAPRVYIPGN